MTREEAIKELASHLVHWKRLKNEHIVPTDECENTINALRMAIEALSEEKTDRPTGEWIDKGEYAECSICGAHSGTQFDGVEPIPLKSKFCHHCGARMKGADDETD